MWFAVSPWLRLPVLLLLISGLFSSLDKHNIQMKPVTSYLFQKYNWYLLGIIVIVWLSYFLGYGLSRSFNHALAYSFTFFGYFYFFYILTEKYNIHSEKIAKVIALSALTICVLIIIEFVLYNFLHFNIRQYVVTVSTDNTNDPIVAYDRKFFVSPPGVAEEPGSTALLLNIYCLIGLFYFKSHNNKKLYRLLLTFFIISHLLLYSAAGIVSVLLAWILSILFNKNRSFKGVFFPIIMLSTLFLIFQLNQDFLQTTYQYLYNKVTISDLDGSSVTRYFAWITAWQNWTTSPWLGKGPGYGAETLITGYLSVILTILSDTGIFSFILFSLFIISNFLILKKIKKHTQLLSISLITALIHFSVISDFYHAPFWILTVLIRKIYHEEQKEVI